MGKVMPICPNRDSFLQGLKNYTKRWIKRRLIEPLSYTFDGNFEEWLSHTNYPEWRKIELRKYESTVVDMLERNAHGELINFTIKLFMKDEHYVKFAQARGIYARDEAAKITFGPWFKGIEHVIYSQPEFIKHVPVSKRANYIYEMLYSEGATYIATDYSSFEAHFTADVMEHCEFVLYEHMLKYANGGREVLELMREVLMGKNTIVNKFVSASCKGRRMSGEMNTSLGNGFSNLMFMGYVAELNGYGDVKGVVEGDDGLFMFVGEHPKTEDFTKLGFIIKLDSYSKISQASFCGNLFDEDSRQIVTDPRKVISMFGWTTAEYRHSKESKKRTLLRCKALSFAHQYPGCPMVGKLSQYGLRVTRGRTNKDMLDFVERNRRLGMWQREKYVEAINARNTDEELYVEPTMGTRLLFEELYGIPVSIQLDFEAYVDSLSTVQPLHYPLLLDFVPESWVQYYQNYVFEFERVPERYALPDTLLN